MLGRTTLPEEKDLIKNIFKKNPTAKVAYNWQKTVWHVLSKKEQLSLDTLGIKTVLLTEYLEDKTLVLYDFDNVEHHKYNDLNMAEWFFFLQQEHLLLIDSNGYPSTVDKKIFMETWNAHINRLCVYQGNIRYAITLLD